MHIIYCHNSFHNATILSFLLTCHFGCHTILILTTMRNTRPLHLTCAVTPRKNIIPARKDSYCSFKIQWSLRYNRYKYSRTSSLPALTLFPHCFLFLYFTHFSWYFFIPLTYNYLLICIFPLGLFLYFLTVGDRTVVWRNKMYISTYILPRRQCVYRMQ